MSQGTDGQFEAFADTVSKVRQSLREHKEAERKLLDTLEFAWTIVCNAGGGDWARESKDWQDAADRLRTQYFALLKISLPTEPKFVEDETYDRPWAYCPAEHTHCSPCPPDTSKSVTGRCDGAGFIVDSTVPSGEGAVLGNCLGCARCDPATKARDATLEEAARACLWMAHLTGRDAVRTAENIRCLKTKSEKSDSGTSCGCGHDGHGPDGCYTEGCSCLVCWPPPPYITEGRDEPMGSYDPSDRCHCPRRHTGRGKDECDARRRP